MRKKMIPKPVTIITGFLGAGKTTFLNHFHSFYRENGRRVLIIENEFGEEGIDSELVIAPDNKIFEFNNGCLCCNLNEDLFTLLEELGNRNETFDELVIETTGIADPAKIAVPFLINQSVSKYYRLERVIGLVDIMLIETFLSKTDEAIRQISFSDILIINKTDSVNASKVNNIKTLLEEINPLASVMTGNKILGYPLKEISDFIRNDNKKDQQWLTHYENHDHHDDDHHHHHQSHNHDHDITSLSFSFSETFNVEKLQLHLMLLLNLQTEYIYRVKGIIQAEQNSNKVVLQSVATFLEVSEGASWKTGEDRISRIVFIGKYLKRKGFEELLRECLTTYKLPHLKET